MHTCFRTESHEVNSAASGFDVLDETTESFDLAHRLRVGESFVDTDNFLVDDTTRTDVLVPYFRVAHDADGETDIESVRHDFGAWPILCKFARHGNIRDLECIKRVVLRVMIFAPAITNHKKYRFHKSNKT